MALSAFHCVRNECALLFVRKIAEGQPPRYVAASLRAVHSVGDGLHGSQQDFVSGNALAVFRGCALVFVSGNEVEGF